MSTIGGSIKLADTEKDDLADSTPHYHSDVLKGNIFARGRFYPLPRNFVIKRECWIINGTFPTGFPTECVTVWIDRTQRIQCAI